MKINNNSVPFHAFEIINIIFKQNDRKEISDVEEIYSKVRINRKAALKYLYKWREKYQGRELKMSLVNFYFTGGKLKNNELVDAIIALQSLTKELEIHSNTLNHLFDHSFPIGNFIINSLQEIEDKLFGGHTYMNKLNNDKKIAEAQLAYMMKENERLEEVLNEVRHTCTKKQKQLQQQLEAKKREVLAAHHLIKSLKREKRKPSLKSFFYDYNLIMSRMEK